MKTLKQRLGISNAMHKKLRRKALQDNHHYSKIGDTKKARESFIKMLYHDDVLEIQNKSNSILSKSQKKFIYQKNKGQNFRTPDSIKHLL